MEQTGGLDSSTSSRAWLDDRSVAVIDRGWRLPTLGLDWRVENALADPAAADALERSLPATVPVHRLGPDAAPFQIDGVPSVVFSDLTGNEDSTDASTSSASERSPKVYVTAGEPDARLWSHAVELRARHLIDRALIDDPRCLAAVTGCALDDPCFFDPAGKVSDAPAVSIDIRSADDRDRFVEDLILDLCRNQLWEGWVDRLRLVAEEVVNNALLHAFESDGGRRYVPGAFTEMLPGHRVSARYAVDGNAVWFAVRDNAGTLTPETVCGHIRHHMTDAGLLDGGGRGIFIAYLGATMLAVNIDRSRSTEIVVVVLPDHNETEKTVLINTLNRS